MNPNYMALTLDNLAGRYRERAYATEPREWVRDKLGEQIWSKQAEIMQSVLRHRYTAVKSCHGAGKSYIASRIAAWWLSVHPPGEAVVVTTAPTAAQVSAILWDEIARAHEKGGLMGYITRGTNPQWKLANGNWVGMGRKPSNYSESAFQGIHRRYVLAIIDEAAGVPKMLFDGVDSIVTNHTSAVLSIGNPTDPTSHFEKTCRPKSGWNVIRIDALETPNMCRSEIDKLPQEDADLLYKILRDEGLEPSTEEVTEEMRAVLTSPTWVVQCARRWGTNSALWTSKVRGLFPKDSQEGVIPLWAVEKAVQRWHTWRDNGREQPIGRDVIGIDVARTGEDRSAVAERVGNVCKSVTYFAGLDTVQLAAEVKLRRVDGRTNDEIPHVISVVDVNGVGGGVYDQLLHDGITNLVAYNSSNKPTHKDLIGQHRFLNRRASSWWNLRELLLDQKQQICLPDDEDLIADLTTPKWKLSKVGSCIQIEEKDDIRKRLGRSTDGGDAVVMAFEDEAGPIDGDGTDPLPWESAVPSDGVNWEGDYDLEGWRLGR